MALTHETEHWKEAERAVISRRWDDDDWVAFCERSGKAIANGATPARADSSAWFETESDVRERENGNKEI